MLVVGTYLDIYASKVISIHKLDPCNATFFYGAFISAVNMTSNWLLRSRKSEKKTSQSVGRYNIRHSMKQYMHVADNVELER